MSLDMFFQHFFNALTLGSLYGLIAIGYTMVYGILRLINFAHGDILMLGAYFVFYGTTTFFLPWGVAVVVAILAASAVGILVDRIAYRPLRDAPRISALISAIAVSFFIESLSVVVFSGLPRPVYQPEWLMTPINFGQLKLLPITLVVPVVSFVLVLGLLWIIHRTKPGLAMRAISKDIETTRLLGVRVDRIIALAFGLGSALAAASGIMWALRYPQINPYMGIFPGFKAFIAPVSLGYSSVDMGLAREALFRIKAFGGLAGFHCEDHALICAGEAKAKAGGGTRRAFLDSRPVVAEVIATANVIELARETGARVHICHVSHPRVAELVRRAQADGLSVTGETCPHYLVFTEENLLSCGTVFKCAPPLRTAEARDGLWEYVLDGTLSCIGSDHSPSRPDEKDEAVHGVMGAWGGLSGLQSLVQVMFDQAVTRRGCSPSLLARFASSSARVFGLDGRKGALGVGLDADAVLIDPGRAWTITAHSLRYLNPFSAFEGLEGVGLPVCTVVRGRVVAREGNVLAPFGHGLFQPRKP